ncbi:hypothetical protein WL99_23290 [Burkholderia cepacia]|uniref:hypothetical protein n=1 Tax=Burkholderia cepacia TaxID=292 RepID=UPI0007594CC8|nr:hypothetical protein [Burkholderia cepacia]KWH25745.1 hypothetical protein WL99_23290 [Burkholderia cepacia]
MPLDDKVISYTQLTQATEVTIRQCIASMSAVDDTGSKLVHADFARGATILWYRIASRLAGDDCDVQARFLHDSERLSALIANDGQDHVSALERCEPMESGPHRATAKPLRSASFPDHRASGSRGRAG